MNILTYTSLSPFTCKESLYITPGKTCFSKNALNKLHKLEEELNIDRIDLEPTILDQESLPTDGSEDAHMVRRLAAALDCTSEYCILQKVETRKVLTEEENKKERSRFKVKGPRDTNIGTDGEKHAYRVLLQWVDVFDYFYPLPHTLISKDVGSKYDLKVSNIMNIIKEQYPVVRLIAADISIELKVDLGRDFASDNLEVSGWHAVVLLIDLREKVWTVEYFDSTGFPPDDFMTQIMENLAKELRLYKKYLKQDGNVETVIVSGRIKHQLTSSECGLHSLIYIRRRLEGISYHAFSRFKNTLRVRQILPPRHICFWVVNYQLLIILISNSVEYSSCNF